MNVRSIGPAVGASAVIAAALSCSVRLADAADAAMQAGPPISTELRPDAARPWPRACSLHKPVCLRAAPGTPRRVQLAAIAAADRAWDTVTGLLHAPAPEGPLGDPWDVYLVDAVRGESRAVPDERDPRSRVDRESTFALVDRGIPTGCPLDFALARAIAEGALWRAAPATDIATARAQSDAVARLATPCAPPPEDDAAFQAAPGRCLLDSTSVPFDHGAGLFVDWVDATFSAEPGAVVVGAWALAATRTEPASWRWSGAPTPFDVLRVSLRNALGPDTTFDDVLLKFAEARATLSPRPALAWSIPWPTQARRLAPAEPVAPTGISYVRVDRALAPAGARLRLEAQWEDFARMRWVVLKRDAADKTLAELVVTSTDRATAASMTVEGLDRVDHLLIVVQNLGSTEHPFYPNQGEWEPHGWLLTLEGLQALGP
jgi:hypothetical protein